MIDPNSRKKEFKEYIHNSFPTPVVTELFELAKYCDVFVFSGIIRDFFSNSLEKPRDLDIVINNTGHSLPERFHKFMVGRKNQFGGAKVRFHGTDIDLWALPDTWGIKREQLEPTPESLVKTAFFNFSSIVYNINEEKFIYTNEFLKFLDRKELDVVCEDNPIPSLCIVSSYYYQKTRNLSISAHLSEWIKQHYCRESDFIDIQERHFGKLLYSNDEIMNFVNNL